MKTIRWGIIGTGYIAGKFAEDYAYVPEGEVAGVASRSAERAEAFAREHKISKAYRSYEQLFKDKDIDVVYIATPHSEHYTNTMSALKHKKAVLCEKPAAVNAGELNEMIATAQKSNLLFMEALWTAFLPTIRQVHRWIEDGVIGDIRLIQADFGAPSVTNPEHRLYNPHLAGGALLDLGIYPLAFANMMVGQQEPEVMARAIHTSTHVDETTSMLLQYPTGALAQLNCSVKHRTSHKGWIFGTSGHIEIPDFWKARQATAKTGDETLPFQDNRESIGFNYEIEAMNRLLKEHQKQSRVMPPKSSLHNLRILDEVRRQIGLVYPFEKASP